MVKTTNQLQVHIPTPKHSIFLLGSSRFDRGLFHRFFWTPSGTKKNDVLCYVRQILWGNVPLKSGLARSYIGYHWIIAPWHVPWFTMTVVGKYWRYHIIGKIKHCTRAFQSTVTIFCTFKQPFFRSVRNRTMIFLLKLSGFVGFPLQVASPSCLKLSTGWWFGTWILLTFHSVGNFTTPTDELTPWFFQRGRAKNHQPAK